MFSTSLSYWSDNIWKVWIGRGWYGWKPSSSSNWSIRAFRAYPLIEIRPNVPCRTIRGSSISVNSTSQAFESGGLWSGGKHRSTAKCILQNTYFELCVWELGAHIAWAAIAIVTVSPNCKSGISGLCLKHMLDFKGWNSEVLRGCTRQSYSEILTIYNHICILCVCIYIYIYIYIHLYIYRDVYAYTVYCGFLAWGLAVAPAHVVRIRLRPIFVLEMVRTRDGLTRDGSY